MSLIHPESINDEESVKEISKLANQYGSEFVNVFYRNFDTKRNVSNLLYFRNFKLIHLNVNYIYKGAQ